MCTHAETRENPGVAYAVHAFHLTQTVSHWPGTYLVGYVGYSESRGLLPSYPCLQS